MYIYTGVNLTTIEVGCSIIVTLSIKEVETREKIPNLDPKVFNIIEHLSVLLCLKLLYESSIREEDIIVFNNNKKTIKL